MAEEADGTEMGKRGPDVEVGAQGVDMNDDRPDKEAAEELVIDGQTEWQAMGCCEVRCKPAEMRCCNGFFQVNPVVFFLSITIIWGFVIYCAADPEAAKEEINNWQSWIIAKWTWLYIGSVSGFAVFDVYLMCSKYGDIVLGDPNEPPRFSYASWFSMLFSAGVGIGLFFYGTAEPVCHYSGYFGGGQAANRWAGLPRDQRAIQAMNLSWFHWGLAPSACYCIVGLPLAYLVHTKGLPCTMRTIFYPLLGNKVYGPIGDLIDVAAVVGTMFGVATSLGLGVMQMSAGLSRLSGNDIKDSQDTQFVIIWIVTVIACVSVMTGLDYGIRRLSEGNFTLGIFVTGLLLIMGNTWFILSYFVETFGNHFWALMDLQFHTDTFQRLESIGLENEQFFMAYWTIFYWGWWISWAPFVGVFIAQISKGRTVREFIMGNMMVPTLMTSVWLTIYGGFGIEMEMKAEVAGVGGNWHVLQPDTKTQNTVLQYTTITTNVATGATSTSVETKPLYDPKENDYAYNAPICGDMDIKDGGLTRLSCRPIQDQLFDMIDTFSMNKFLGGITLVAIVTYFVTSSDSGSHVIDMMCANGEEEPPIIQRIFWAISEGAVAHVLLDAGGADALAALQTASIAAGLPFCMIMIAMVFSTLAMFRQWEVENPDGVPPRPNLTPTGEIEQPRRGWRLKLCMAMDQALKSSIFCCMKEKGNNRTPLDILASIIAPCWIQQRLDRHTKSAGTVATKLMGSMFICFVLFHILEAAEQGIFSIGWMFYFCFVGILCYQRTEFRRFYLLEGDMGTDCCQAFFCYPCILLQELSEAEIIEELELSGNTTYAE